jgi:hypothetical protein
VSSPRPRGTTRVARRRLLELFIGVLAGLHFI